MDQFFFLLVVVLFPGVLAAMIADKIVAHGPWGSFRFGLYAFVLGVACYIGAQLLFWLPGLFTLFTGGEPTWRSLRVWDNVEGEGITPRLGEIALATGLALPTAFLASWVIYHKAFNKLAQRLGVTSKFGDENLYSYYLNSQDVDWIYIRDRDAGLTYQGRVVSFSENAEIQEIVIAEVSVYHYDDSALLYSVPSAYLSRPLGQFVIEAVPDTFLEN